MSVGLIRLPDGLRGSNGVCAAQRVLGGWLPLLLPSCIILHWQLILLNPYFRFPRSIPSLKIQWFCYLNVLRNSQETWHTFLMSFTTPPHATCNPRPAVHSHRLFDHLFLSLPQSDRICPITMCILHSLSKHWLCDTWSMSQAWGKEGLFLKFICNCESIQACAGMPALPLKKKNC